MNECANECVNVHIYLHTYVYMHLRIYVCIFSMHMRTYVYICSIYILTRERKQIYKYAHECQCKKAKVPLPRAPESGSSDINNYDLT